MAETLALKVKKWCNCSDKSFPFVIVLNRLKKTVL